MNHNRLDKNGNRHGFWIHYWDDESNIQRKGRYAHGKEIKTWKYYSLEGKLIKTEQYNRSQQIITIKTYHPNGKKESQGQACLVNEEGSLHFYWQGEWKFYDDHGRLERTEWYEKGSQKSHSKN
jgi:antitoxin component YwqK of YwqJK toxin-antitoxin module